MYLMKSGFKCIQEYLHKVGMRVFKNASQTKKSTQLITKIFTMAANYLFAFLL